MVRPIRPELERTSPRRMVGGGSPNAAAMDPTAQATSLSVSPQLVPLIESATHLVRAAQGQLSTASGQAWLPLLQAIVSELGRLVPGGIPGWDPSALATALGDDVGRALTRGWMGAPLPSSTGPEAQLERTHDGVGSRPPAGSSKARTDPSSEQGGSGLRGGTLASVKSNAWSLEYEEEDAAEDDAGTEEQEASVSTLASQTQDYEKVFSQQLPPSYGFDLLQNSAQGRVTPTPRWIRTAEVDLLKPATVIEGGQGGGGLDPSDPRARSASMPIGGGGYGTNHDP